MQFEFATATRIVFGAGALAKGIEAACGWGRRALLVTAATTDRSNQLPSLLSEQHVEVAEYRVTGEPSVESIRAGLAVARAAQCDIVIAIGGGSVLDSGKAIAILLTNPGDVLDYLELIGRGRSLEHPPVPFVAIPTTAGTGAEVTRNAVIGSTEHRVKVSLRSPLMLPRLAVIDPLLTCSVPPPITAATGLDALTQVIEPFVTHAHNPLTDGICREGMRRAARSLRAAYADGSDLAAREDMCVTSLCGGLALANAKLGAVHGIAGPLGGMFPAPHGAICAALLPHVMATNIRALQQRQTGFPALQRFDEVAQCLTGDHSARAADGQRWISQLCADLHIPSLRTYGIAESDFPELIDLATRASSMQGNPIRLESQELAEILHQAW